MTKQSRSDVAKLLDHALLSPSLSERELEAGCREAISMGVASVCTMPYFLPRAAELLRGSGVLATTTVGFPHGAHATSIKAAEARRALADGAEELDMVVNIGKVRSGDWDYVRADVAAVLGPVRESGKKIKVIFENCYLDDSHKRRLCEICGELSVDWVKTSTGFGSGGATDADLALMRAASPPHVQLKASGGIRDYQRLLQVVALGATRVGTSRTADILAEA
jgi:deoxyribose-phosphate aldolase